MLDADTVINNSSQKVDGSNAYPDPAPKKWLGPDPPKTHRIYAPDSVACSITGHITRRQLHPRASKQSRPCSTYTRSRHTEIGTVSLPASSRWVRVTAVHYELYYMRSQQSRSGGSYETLASSIPLSLPKYNQVSSVPQSGHPIPIP